MKTKTKNEERKYKVSFNSAEEDKVRNILYDYFANKYTMYEIDSFMVTAGIEDLEFYLTLDPQIGCNTSIQPVEE
ncbi:MAG: hypothetical protein FWF54_08510 [Candidatus Azobacteroides sp.]|nr:hypothetical protein [Candidatus Azobacteroides sp.]